MAHHTAPFVLPAEVIEMVEALAIRAETSRSVVAQALLEYALPREEECDGRIAELKEARKRDPSLYRSKPRFPGYVDRPTDAYLKARQKDLIPDPRWW